jgi:hypothetical protein
MVVVLQTSILTSSGIFTLPYMLTVSTQFREFQFLWDPGILNQIDMMLVLSASYREVTDDCLANQELMANASCNVTAYMAPCNNWDFIPTTEQYQLHMGPWCSENQRYDAR